MPPAVNQQPVAALQNDAPIPPSMGVTVPPIPPIFGAGVCFSEDSWVITPEGKKAMSDLQVGDYVLTTAANEVG